MKHKKNGPGPVQVALIGAGYAANFHMEVLSRMEDAKICGVCDIDEPKAVALARRWGIKETFGSVEQLLEKVRPDIAHVVVPPPLHSNVAGRLLSAGVTVFLEKPMAPSVVECRNLVSIASKAGVSMGVNHNYLFHPLFRRLRHDSQSHRIGPVQHVVAYLSVPLRQLSTKDFGHWMFRQPENIVFERLPHPLSQIIDILGVVRSIKTVVTEPRELVEGCLVLYDTWLISLECERGTAQIYFAPGSQFPEDWMHVSGSDGSIHVDFYNNVYMLHEGTRWLDFFNSFLSGWRNSWRLGSQSLANLFGYPLALTKITERRDPFYLSMKGSISAFYGAWVNKQRPPCSGEDGLAVIECCSKLAESLPVAKLPIPVVPLQSSRPSSQDDVLIIGATGFIGRALVQKLLKEGYRIRVMVRNPDLVPQLLRDPTVRVMRGEITSREAIRAAVEGIKVVYHLATGDTTSAETIDSTMVGGLRHLAEACIEANVLKLFFVSSIVAYYLGGNTPVTEEIPIDSSPHRRGLYARGKIMCERFLQDFYNRRRDLDITIIRPAVVVGRGGITQHGGLGLWVREGQCLGWGRGDIPVPFVLVDDVADAMVKALALKGPGFRSFNLAGDVRLTAREYVKLLADFTGRNFQFFPRSLWLSQVVEIVKWMVKRAIIRTDAAFPSYHDLLSRTFRAPLDCSKAKAALNWSPVADENEFIRQAIHLAVAKPRRRDPKKFTEGTGETLADSRTV
jgi:predicted dehydrogenase/nucleoside-diphosphate-sugar epimerase